MENERRSNFIFLFLFFSFFFVFQKRRTVEVGENKNIFVECENLLEFLEWGNRYFKGLEIERESTSTRDVSCSDCHINSLSVM